MNYSNGNEALNSALSNSYQKTDPTRFCYKTNGHWKKISLPLPRPKINYVIATWSGDRRAGKLSPKTGSLPYLQYHIDQLQKLNHKLDQITLMMPENPNEDKEFSDYVVGIEKEITVIRRKNEGQSYGSWVDCYKQYKDTFDYYIFVEDDYVPNQPHFDDVLLKMFLASENCGYLCSRVDKYPPTNYMGRPHAAISNGITSSEVLGKICDELGDIPCGRKATKQHNYAATPQLEFSWAFLDAGFWLYDYSSFFSAPYHHVGQIQHYGSIKTPPLFTPIQSILKT